MEVVSGRGAFNHLQFLLVLAQPMDLALVLLEPLVVIQKCVGYGFFEKFAGGSCGLPTFNAELPIQPCFGNQDPLTDLDSLDVLPFDSQVGGGA